MQLGSLFVLASTLLYALHTAIVKRYGGGIEFLNFFFYRLLATTAFLLLFAGVGHELVWPDAATWVILLVAGTVDVVISRALYYLTLRTFPMSIHTIILTLSPVVSIIIAVLLVRHLSRRTGTDWRCRSPGRRAGGDAWTVTCACLMAKN